MSPAKGGTKSRVLANKASKQGEDEEDSFLPPDEPTSATSDPPPTTTTTSATRRPPSPSKTRATKAGIEVEFDNVGENDEKKTSENNNNVTFSTNTQTSATATTTIADDNNHRPSVWTTVTKPNCDTEYELAGDFYPRACRVFDTTDKAVIRERIIVYTQTIELINARCETDRYDPADWALAMAMAPEWYGGKLTERLQNSMLVSALLLTVSAEMFISPPVEDRESATFRVTAYLAGICNVVLLLSIITGVWFIENAMSRSYGQSERFVLIMKYYSLKDVSQVLGVVGSALFPVLLVTPVWDLYVKADAFVLTFMTVAAVLFSLAIVVWSTQGSSHEQARRLHLFKTLIEPNSGGRLYPEYYPADEEFQPKDYQKMYQETWDSDNTPPKRSMLLRPKDSVVVGGHHHHSSNTTKNDQF